MVPSGLRPLTGIRVSLTRRREMKVEITVESLRPLTAIRVSLTSYTSYCTSS